MTRQIATALLLLLHLGAQASPIWSERQFILMPAPTLLNDFRATEDGFAVGNPPFSANTGTVQLVSRAGNVYVLGGRVDPAGASPGSLFGTRIDVDGTLLAVAQPNTALIGGAVQGQARIYGWNGMQWLQLAAVGGETGIGPSDRFGSAIAIAGDVVAVGAIGVLSQRGAVHLYSEQGGAWRDIGTLLAFDGSNFANLGASLDGAPGVIIAGAPNQKAPAPSADAPGAAYVFAALPDGSWAQRQKLSPSQPVNLGQLVKVSQWMVR